MAIRTDRVKKGTLEVYKPVLVFVSKVYAHGTGALIPYCKCKLVYISKACVRNRRTKTAESHSRFNNKNERISRASFLVKHAQLG